MTRLRPRSLNCVCSRSCVRLFCFWCGSRREEPIWQKIDYYNFLLPQEGRRWSSTSCGKKWAGGSFWEVPIFSRPGFVVCRHADGARAPGEYLRVIWPKIDPAHLTKDRSHFLWFETRSIRRQEPIWLPSAQVPSGRRSRPTSTIYERRPILHIGENCKDMKNKEGKTPVVLSNCSAWVCQPMPAATTVNKGPLDHNLAN